MSDQPPADRVRTLLLRADNLLKNAGDPADRERRAREALLEARAAAAGVTGTDDAVDPRVVELIERRLTALDAGAPG